MDNRDTDVAPPEIESIDLSLTVDIKSIPAFERGLTTKVHEARLLTAKPWTRSFGSLDMKVSSDGWRFPTPMEIPGSENSPADVAEAKLRVFDPEQEPADVPPKVTRLQPPKDTVQLKDRLLYLLQPPLESLFAGRRIQLPFSPYPYQLEGIAFLMPRNAALLADEMGLGKTMQTIVALRLLFHSGLIQRALLVCPKPLVHNWSRELQSWAHDLPFDIISGDAESRKTAWLVSNCPLKIVNYESLSRDVDLVAEESLKFDVVVLDEAQRIKNRTSKTAQVVRSIKRSRSWALTGTPIENRHEDLINIFAFVDEGRIPVETPPNQLPKLTSDSILRRTKEDVLNDMPPKTVRDSYLDLTPAQQEAYRMAEKEGIVQLSALGETISVQHVFELVMRLKQICNFDPVTGQSAKADQLETDMAEIAESGRKAIVFSQWVQPLERLADRLSEFGPLQYHGKVPHKKRTAILQQFRDDPTKHVILMSYGTGSVGLNLQFTNYVFLFDRWWNPAIEDQAINRAHRIGQKEPVIVTRFVSQNTIEGRIAEVLESKRELFNEVIDRNGAPSSMGLSQEEIFGLFNIKGPVKRGAAA